MCLKIQSVIQHLTLYLQKLNCESFDFGSDSERKDALS